LAFLAWDKLVVTLSQPRNAFLQAFFEAPSNRAKPLRDRANLVAAKLDCGAALSIFRAGPKTGYTPKPFLG
jgi:hypothetical protein